jgi:hypothetical protein
MRWEPQRQIIQNMYVRPAMALVPKALTNHSIMILQNVSNLVLSLCKHLFGDKLALSLTDTDRKHCRECGNFDYSTLKVFCPNADSFQEKLDIRTGIAVNSLSSPGEIAPLNRRVLS